MSNRFVSRSTIQERWDSAPTHPPDNGAPELEAYSRANEMLEMATLLSPTEWIASDVTMEDTDGW